MTSPCETILPQHMLLWFKNRTICLSLGVVTHAVDYCSLKTTASAAVSQNYGRISVHLVQIKISRGLLFNCAVLTVVQEEFQRCSKRNEVLTSRVCTLKTAIIKSLVWCYLSISLPKHWKFNLSYCYPTAFFMAVFYKKRFPYGKPEKTIQKIYVFCCTYSE